YEARLAGGPGALADQVPQLPGGERLPHLPVPDQLPLPAGLDRFHEAVGDADREVGVVDPGEVLLDGDELLDVRVVVVEHQHQGAPARAALLDDVPGGDGVQLGPGAGAGGGAVD